MQFETFRKRAHSALSALLTSVALHLAAVPASAQTLTPFKIGISAPVVTIFPVWMGDVGGFYAKEGLKVEVINMEGGTRGLQVLLSGEIQGMHVGLAPAVLANKQGADLRLVTSTCNTIPITMFTKPGVTMKDLKGKNIGISTFGSETDIAVSILLKQQGLTRKDVTVTQIGGSSQRFAALVAGRIDVAPLIEPGITLAKQKGFSPLIDLAAAKTPWIFDSVVVSNSYLKQNRETLTKFVRGYIAGAYLALSDEAKAKEVIAQRFRTKDQTVIDATYNDFKRLMPRDAAPTVAGAENVLEQLVALGTDIGSRNPNDYLDLSIIEQLKRDGYFDQMAKLYPVNSGATVNAIDLEVIYQSTLQIARELTLNMLRTGYSTIIKESQDFTFAIFDGGGRMVAQGIPQPLHIGPLTAQVNEIRRRFRGQIAPGDAFIVNHPYQACQNHATDVTLISPIFIGERICGFIGNIAHKPDLGGKVPGTNSGDATDLFQEGLLLPPLKIMRGGELNADIETIICANTRTPEVTWGDVKAQLNTNTFGLTKFAELFGKYGVDNVLACWTRWMEIVETELRKEIAKAPDGRYGPETDWLDDDGVDLAKPHRISASLEVKGDTLNFILDSDAQARGPINLRPCVSRNFIECLVKMIFIPHLPVNDGLSRPVKVSYPQEGSLLNPRYPAPVNMYVRPSQVTTSVVMRTLARAVPERVPAPGSAAGGSLSSAGRHPVSGRWYSQYEILNGGTGARHDADGVSVMDELVINVMNTPVEAVETEFPVRIESYGLAVDSGGPGKFRGGLGVRRQWRILADESIVNLRMDRFKFSSPGLFGAKPARASSAVLNAGRPDERPLTSKIAGLRLKRDDLLSVDFAGGGGLGNPLKREPSRVRDDVVRGYVSREAAREDYGVVLDPTDLEIDAQATAQLRQKTIA